MADREEVEEMLLKMRQCEEEIGKVIIGQREVVHEIMLAILADGNIL